MNSKQRRKYIRANLPAARVELIARTLTGVPYRNAPRILANNKCDREKFEVVRHFKQPQIEWSSQPSLT